MNLHHTIYVKTVCIITTNTLYAFTKMMTMNTKNGSGTYIIISRKALIHGADIGRINMKYKYIIWFNNYEYSRRIDLYEDNPAAFEIAFNNLTPKLKKSYICHDVRLLNKNIDKSKNV